MAEELKAVETRVPMKKKSALTDEEKVTLKARAKKRAFFNPRYKKILKSI